MVYYRRSYRNYRRSYRNYGRRYYSRTFYTRPRSGPSVHRGGPRSKVGAKRNWQGTVKTIARAAYRSKPLAKQIWNYAHRRGDISKYWEVANLARNVGYMFM